MKGLAMLFLFVRMMILKPKLQGTGPLAPQEPCVIET